MFAFCFLSPAVLTPSAFGLSASCVRQPLEHALAERIAHSARSSIRDSDRRVLTPPTEFRCSNRADHSGSGYFHRRRRNWVSEGWKALSADGNGLNIDWSRSPADELATLIGQSKLLEGGALSALQGGYADMAIAEYQLRLFAIAAPTDFLGKSTELQLLNLLLLLQPVASSYLPIGTTLSIQDQYSLYAEPSLQWASDPVYLCTSVFCPLEAQLTVAVHLPNARPAILPTLTFHS